MILNFRMKSLIRLFAVFAIVLQTMSCSNDAFFGFDEDGVKESESPYDYIAKSAEYIEYQRGALDFLNTIQNIDTTKMEFVGIFYGKPLYKCVADSDISHLLHSMDILADVFPEYKELNTIEKAKLQDFAMRNNKHLQSIMDYKPIAPVRTKSYDSEHIMNAHSWMISEGISLYDVNRDVWRYGNTGIYLGVGNYLDCIAQSITNTINYNKERGGYCWANDASGVMIVDTYSGEFWMGFPPVKKQPYPTFDFHVHPNPSRDKTPSTYDISAWGNSVISIHMICDIDGGYSYYYM